MWRKVLAGVLTALGGLSMAVLLVAVESIEARDPDRVPLVIVLVVLGLVPAGMLLAGWALMRRASRPPEPTIGWMPAGQAWLPQHMWRELPDVLARPRRHRPRPMPAIGVPPDEGLRKLWAVRAEIGYDRRRPLGWLPVAGWLGMMALMPLGVFLVAVTVITVDDYQRGKDIGVNLLLVDWLACLVVASWLAFVRPLVRHVRLVRLELRLTEAMRGRPDAGAPLPAGLAGRVTDPATGMEGYYHPQLGQVRSAAGV